MYLYCEFLSTLSLPPFYSIIYMCGSGSVFGIRIQKAPEYGSGSTTLVDTHLVEGTTLTDEESQEEFRAWLAHSLGKQLLQRKVNFKKTKFIIPPVSVRTDVKKAKSKNTEFQNCLPMNKDRTIICDFSSCYYRGLRTRKGRALQDDRAQEVLSEAHGRREHK